MKHYQLYWRAVGIWSMVIFSVFEFVVLPLVVAYIFCLPKFDLVAFAQFIGLWTIFVALIAFAIALSLTSSAMDTSSATDASTEGKRIWDLQAWYRNGERILPYANLIYVLYALVVFVIWRRFLLPLVAMTSLAKTNLIPPDSDEN